jgi:glycosyltransferase involved in cell wall biosynthesis
MGNSLEENKVKLSIITVNLNNKNGLQKTISSVLSQTMNFFEFIIIDGSSSDGSVELITQNQNRISFWLSEPDSGIYQAMNKGIRIAKGEYVLFLNSGDFLVDNEVLINVFKGSNTEDLLYGRSYISREDKVIYTTPHPDKLTLEFFYTQTISHQAAFIRRSLFERFGYYREDLKIYADLDFWIRTIILNDCTTKKLDIIVADYNLEGISGSPSNEELAKAEIKDVLSKNIPPRILADYENRKEERKQMKVLYWAKSVKALNTLLTVLYQIALKVNSIRKAFKNLLNKKKGIDN